MNTIVNKIAKTSYPVTFFVNGNNGLNYPLTQGSAAFTMINNAITKGHEVQNHGWSHTSLPSLTGSALVNEIKKVNDALVKYTAKKIKPTILRPPYGDMNAEGKLNLIKSSLLLLLRELKL